MILLIKNLDGLYRGFMNKYDKDLVRKIKEAKRKDAYEIFLNPERIQEKKRYYEEELEY